MTQAYAVQVAFRGRDDDVAINSTTWTHAQDTNWTQAVDVNFRLRFEIEEQNAKNFTFQGDIEYSLNSGSWNLVGVASSVIRTFTSSNFTDGDATTNLLTGSSKSFVAGSGDEDGSVSTIVISNQHTEVEYCLQIVGADVADSDTIQIRAASVNAWTSTPTITVSKSTPDALTAVDMTSGTPAIEQTTIGQTHVLTSVDVVSGTPTLEMPTLGQKHVLTALDIVSGTPAIEQATATDEVGDTEDNLTALYVVSGVPAIDTPTLGQVHDLTSLDIVSGTPSVEQSNIGQVHALTSIDILSGQPTIEASGIGQVHTLTANDIQSGTPTIETPTAGEPVAGQDDLVALDVVSGQPVIEQSTIGQKHVLASTDILAGTSTIDTPTASEVAGVDILTSIDIQAGTPTLDQSTIGQVHGLTLADLLFGTPTLEQATIKQVHELLSQDIIAGTITIEQATATGFVQVAMSLGSLTSRTGVNVLETRNDPLELPTRERGESLGGDGFTFTLPTRSRSI